MECICAKLAECHGNGVSGKSLSLRVVAVKDSEKKLEIFVGL